MSTTITLNGTFVTMECCHEGCGITFAMTQDFNRQLQESRNWFYCPRGHEQHYTAESDKARAERLAREANDALARERAHHDQTRAHLETTKRSRAAVLGASRRIRERAKHGVCPCCNRTFADMARHMATKHPKFDAEVKP